MAVRSFFRHALAGVLRSLALTLVLVLTLGLAGGAQAGMTVARAGDAVHKGGYDPNACMVRPEFTLQAMRDAEIPPMSADVIPLLLKEDQERLKIESNVLIY